MAHVLNYPLNTTKAIDRWRVDADERKSGEERFKKELKVLEEAKREQRRGGLSKAQSDESNAWFDARFAQAFAAAVAEGSPFDSEWIEDIRAALSFAA